MSLRLKMLFSIVGTMTLVVVLLGTWATLESWQRSATEREERISWNKRMVESWVVDRVTTGTDRALRDEVQPLVEARAMGGYCVLAADGSIEECFDVAGDPFPVSSYRDAPAGHPEYLRRPIPWKEGEAVLVVRVDAPPVAERANLRFLAGLLWVMVLGTALLVFVLFLLFNSLLLRPLDRLLETSRRVALGDYSAMVASDEARSDELGQLMVTFGYMLDEIRTYSDELKERMEGARQKIRKTERSLVVAQRLAATGTLAAGIAHEINNPIGGMLNAAYWLAKDGKDPKKRQTYAELIVDGLTRVQETVRKVLQFSPRRFERRPSSIAAVIDRARSLCEHRFRENDTEVEVEFPEDMPEIVIDPLEIQQVFLNLFINAIDATGAGGHIRVSGEVHGPDVILRVEDDGIGMSTEEATRAMDLFFTTKEQGKGTGLGLSIVHNVINNHGGNLEIESEPGKGTTMKITLPIDAPDRPDDGGDGLV